MTFYIPVVPPADDRPPMEGGRVPGDDSDVGVAGFASQEGGVERAGNKGPEGAAHDRIVLEHAADKQRRLPDDGWERVRSAG